MIDVNMGQEDIIDPFQPLSLQGVTKTAGWMTGAHIHHDGYRDRG